ncbi:MAG: hypothetical protein RRY35_05575 [Clostridiales bacterium]
MQIVIYPRGLMRQYFSGESQLVIQAVKGVTVAQVLKQSGLDWEKCPNFGFIAINGKRATIYQNLSDGDILKVFPTITGG